MALRRFEGVVLEFNPARGFGYVRVLGPHAKAFLHIREFPPDVGAHDVRRGSKISCFLENHERGLRAIRAELVQ